MPTEPGKQGQARKRGGPKELNLKVEQEGIRRWERKTRPTQAPERWARLPGGGDAASKQGGDGVGMTGVPGGAEH